MNYFLGSLNSSHLLEHLRVLEIKHFRTVEVCNFHKMLIIWPYFTNLLKKKDDISTVLMGIANTSLMMPKCNDHLLNRSVRNFYLKSHYCFVISL